MSLLRRERTHGSTALVAASGSKMLGEADYGCIGVNDDVIIQQAIDYVGERGRIELSDGPFYLGNYFNIMNSHVALEGQGMRTTELFMSNGANTNAIRITAGANLETISLKGFTIHGNKTNQSDQGGRNDLAGIHVIPNAYTIANLRIDDVQIFEIRHGAAAVLDKCTRLNVHNSEFRSNGVVGAAFPCDGVWIGNSNFVTVNGCTFNDNTDTGLAIDYTDFAQIANCYASSNTENGFTFAAESTKGQYVNVTARLSKAGIRTGKYGAAGNTEFLSIIGSYLLDNSEYGIRLDDHDNGLIDDNTFAGNTSNTYQNNVTNLVFVDAGKRIIPLLTYAELDSNTKQFPVGIRIPADTAPGDTWERAVYYAPNAVKVCDVGIVPDVAFGQATNYATIAVQNKESGGAGTVAIASKAFDGAVSAYDYTTLGAITNPTIDAGEVLTFKKTITASGEIVPAGWLILYLERAG